MGMIGVLRRASDDDLGRVLREPRLVLHLLDEEGFAGEPPARRGFFARLFGRAAPAAAPPVPVFERVEGDEMDVDKAWHGLHYLLTGTADEGDPPACYLVHGGEEVRGVEVGYGAARVIRPAQVRDFARFLTPITRDGLLEDYDAGEMRELDIYPDIWDDEEGAREYLWEHFQLMRVFVATAAERGEGLVIYLG